MNSLRIPDNGVLLKAPPGPNAGPLPTQAFTLSLSDNVIQDMIKCAQNGGDLRLALGKTPTFHYGSKTHRVSKPLETSPHDLYLTQPYESTREAHRIPYAGSLFEKPKAGPAKAASNKVQKSGKSQSKPVQGGNASSSSLDSDIEVLQGRLAAHGAAKEKSVIVNGLPASRKGAAKAKSKFLAGSAASPRSMPTSPALKPTTALSPNPSLSTSEQLMERLKLQRRSLVHELAVGEQTLAHLEAVWEGKPEDFRTALEKVASDDPATGKWSMKKATFWRELDVWQYDYGSEERREKAIENAIKQYDKARLSASEPEWQRLLPVDERNKGKNLSRLQGRLANGPAPPKIKVQKADDSSTSTSKDDGELGQSDRGKMGGESMSRSSSNPLPKAKKPAAQSSQAKRLLSNSKAKPSASTPKASPAKKATTAKANNSRVLSQEFIENSDSSGDEQSHPAPAPVAKPVSPVKTAPKPAERQAEKPAPKPVAKPRSAKPVAREPVRQVSTKRPREPEEDDTSSSSSGSPLSKRLKPRQPLAAPAPKKRPADVRQPPRDNVNSYVSRNKNTSPVKSSPLAASPPTNASDFSEEERPIVKKRKALREADEPPAKRQAVPSEVVLKAQKFRSVYEKYEALHYEIVKVENPPDEKLDRLQQLRDRLQGMKADIYRQCSPVGR